MQPEHAPRCDPAFLGPLTDEPVVTTGPVRLFAGEEDFFPTRKLDERERLWSAVAPHLERVLDRDETVLHLMPTLHVPRGLEVLGFGVWWSLFFRAAVVLTDRRLIEIFMPTWQQAGTRIGSYSWAQVQKLKLSMGTLTLKPAKGGTQKWKLPVRGDRKLMKLMVPRIQTLLPGDIHMPRPVPLWHCPECGAASEKHPKTCSQCDAVFKSSRLAAALALCFPGAGLFYTGHTMLGLLDLFGEVILFFLVASIFLVAGTTEEIAGAVIIGLVLLFITKLESVHLATVLVKRTVPEPHPGRWRKVAAVGALVSLVLMAVPPMLTGVFAERLDSDLDFTTNTLGWSGGHDPAQWQFGSDVNQRSEWIRDDGQALFVFSMPVEEGGTLAAINSVLREEGEETERKVFAGFGCIRSIGEVVDETGNDLIWVRWFLVDAEHNDLHILAASVVPEELGDLEPEVESLVQSATWIPVED